jgi:hypothetical protein
MTFADLLNLQEPKLDRLRELADGIKNQHPQYCRQRTWQKLFEPFISPLSDNEAKELYNLLPPCKCCET